MSSVAGAVVTIDGDSSGLVSALQKGEKGIADVKQEAGKLSDQLREVADDADKAAGAMIQKLGGPGAIKAIAGVTAGFAIAKQGVEMFLDSAENLFKSFGEEGQKVWEDTEKSLFAIKGALAEAVLGGGSAEEMGARLKSIFEGVKIALDVLLLPIRALSALVRGLGTDFKEVSGYVQDASDKLNELASTTRLAGLTKTGEGIEGLRVRLMTLRGETENLRQVELARDIAGAERLKTDILANELQADAIASSAAVVAAQGDIAKKADEARLKYLKDLGEEKFTQADLAAARRVYNAEMLAQGQLVMAQQMKQREGISQSAKAQLDEVNAQIAAFKEIAATPPEAKTGTGGGGPKKPEKTAAEIEAEEVKAINDLRLAITKGEQQLEMDKLKLTAERTAAEADAKEAALKRYLDFEKQMLDEAAAERKAKGILTAEEEDALYQERKAKALAYVQDLAGQEMGIYMQNAGKQLALGKLSAKAASDMARSALGNMIIGQGDKAMVEAGIMAAALNPLAIPMAAAGLAAYAVGNAMMPTVKPTAGSTPATEKPADGGQAASNNYSFNMRVDSVFADGESVARQFAMMQESARQRGLLYQGA